MRSLRRAVGLAIPSGSAALLVLASCTSLPVMVPDLARRPAANSPAPRLSGARGPLTVEQSRSLLQSLHNRAQPSDIFERHLVLEEAIVGSPLTAGNEVTLLQDGPATYRAMFAAIEAAVDHIHLETYILDDDEVGQRFAELLIAKRRQGVQVSLIRDSAGTVGTPTAFFDALAAAGVQVLEFNPLNPMQARQAWELNRRDHRKLLIVDGHTAFLGGINVSSVYSGSSFGRGSRARRATGPAWRDTDLRLRGPVVAELQKVFLATWASQKGEPMTARALWPRLENVGRQVVRVIASAPDEPFSLIYATLLSAIDSAETSVRLTNAYFVPDPQLLASLEAAAARGVEVTLILPGATDSWLVFHAGRSEYERLLVAGVRIFERRDVILHAKTALIDGVWATVGSTNLDWRSFLHNHELDAMVLGPDFGRQVQAMFDRDLAGSQRIELAQWERRPIQMRLKEQFARLWAYWL